MGKILIVDDEKSVRVTLSEFLKEDNHEVVTAKDSWEAIKLLADHNYDVIVTDIIMPNLSGVDLLKTIHKASPDVMVILITGMPTIGTASEALREGAFDYITKPIRDYTIKKAVSRALSLKKINEAKKKLEIENKRYREQLEELVEQRTAELWEANKRLKKEYNERIQIENQLKQLATAVEQSPISVLITNTDGIIEYANPNFFETTGYTKKEIIGKEPNFQNSGIAFEENFRDIIKTVSKGENWYGELHNMKKNGDYFWDSVSISPVRNNSGVITHYLSIMENITERKEMEKRIAEISENEQRRIGSDLHDGIGQELTGIAFVTKTLVSKLEKKSLPEVEEANNIVNLVNRTISHTQFLAKGLYPVNLRDGISSALRDLAIQTEHIYNIKCDYKTSENIMFIDESIGIHLYRITQEAVNNALKHGKAKNIKIDFQIQSDNIELTITDDGSGLPQAPERGKGLGLSVMGNRARLINASIKIIKNRNKGTIVKCTLKKG